ncbi:hypothetical protein SNE510_01200 [Streptomyces sp. NE5-10]|uniref:DUF6412 domain-containing protein n=1 Tax=Streptomyces sp. NE5-10 TaxID=2759674 RepID=UPI0019032ABA|nr:DUF6412 domain-containing protein [Streptomyces sp. NE5-10]GHJ90601.1 hypothetical protein SNE510_01200 [Streptomyces sp. NE5-10]
MSGSLVLRRRAPLVLLSALLALAVVLSGPAGPHDAVGAAVVLAVSVGLCALVGARTAPAAAPTLVRTALRDRARRTAFLPQRDPDAAGRRRPRAPGHSLPTAA